MPGNWDSSHRTPQQFRALSQRSFSFSDLNACASNPHIELLGSDRRWNVPEPDLALLGEANPEFSRRHPRADETVLIVEVADTTARYGLSTKRDLYAHSGAPEYWVLDLGRRSVIVHRDLRPDSGTYADTRVVAAHETVLVSGKEIAVTELLPHDV
ncbi:MAG: Uma2 family endonuclease [Acidobacteria bacterium]|nr:Uma2 family endonuclease [Acidobacteriota bacterium]